MTLLAAAEPSCYNRTVNEWWCGDYFTDYRGELMVALVNLGPETFQITRGMRIAQMIIARVERVAFRTVETLPPSMRGTGGFGSTGG